MTEPHPTSLPAPAGRPRRAGPAAALLLVLLFAGACHTWRPAPVDLADSAWTVTPSQAVWRPAGREVELAGDLLLATTADGKAYLQFGKGPVVLAEARLDAGHWMARFPARDRTYSGPGSAPSRLAWNQLLLVLVGRRAAEGWTWSGTREGSWRLEHPGSGEWIEGARLP